MVGRFVGVMLTLAVSMYWLGRFWITDRTPLQGFPFGIGFGPRGVAPG